jgi:hypothetical protein
MALRVDDDNDEDDDNEAELRQSNTCKHRHLLRASGASRFPSGSESIPIRDVLGLQTHGSP